MTGSHRRNRTPVQLALAILAGLALLHALPSTARAQQHGLTLLKNCASPKAPGQPVECDFTVVHADSVGVPAPPPPGTDDSSEIIDVRDVVLGQTFDSSVIPIFAVAGNTNCTTSNPASTVLPCRVCRALSTHCGLTSANPGFGAAGQVQFRVVGPVIPDRCPAPSIPDTAFADWVDNCESGDPGCVAGAQTDDQPSNTVCEDVVPPLAANFKCYKAKLELGTPFQRKALPLVDQFGANSGVIVAPFEFCNPVDKNGEGIADPESHLMCYKMTSRRRVSERVVDRDQFGDETLVLASAASLCLPAIKNGQGDLDDLQSRANHYQCYRARTDSGTDPISPQDLVLSDQFGSEVEHTTQQTSLHCNPLIEKGTEQVLVDPDAHLKCYDITAGSSSPAIPPHVTVEDQFGEKNLVIGEAIHLCEPAVKTLATTLFAWEEFASNLYTIDTAGPTPTFIGGPNSGIIAEIESRGGSIYAADTDDNTKLHRVDPATGLYKSTTTLTFPPEGNVLTSLEFVGSTLYAGLTTEGGGETYLSTVDLGSGVVTVVGGPSGVGSPLGGLAWNGTTMYAISAGGSPAELFTIDLGSGVATSVGLVTLGGNGFGATALEFGDDGVLYSLPNTNEGNAGHLLSIDPATGDATDLGDTGISGLVALTSRAR